SHRTRKGVWGGGGGSAPPPPPPQGKRRGGGGGDAPPPPPPPAKPHIRGAGKRSAPAISVSRTRHANPLSRPNKKGVVFTTPFAPLTVANYFALPWFATAAAFAAISSALPR
ncbi:hypothetical protein BS420_20930, partial [Cronobacter sakazakii]